MFQDNLWASRARCIGLQFIYQARFTNDGINGHLHVQPTWSKNTQKDGYVHLELDEHETDLVPELFREAWDGINSTDPGYYVPRWVKDHLKNYQDATDKKL